MTEAEKWGLPTRNDLRWLLEKEDDPLRIVVRGWQWVEGLLGLVIADRLPAGADLVEVARLQTSVKIDMCAGMGAVPLADHGSFVRMNAMRNQFVHKRKVKLSRKDGYDVFNTWSPMFRSTARPVTGRSGPVLIVRTTLVVQCIVLRAGIENYRDGLLQQDLLLENLISAAKELVPGFKGATSSVPDAEFVRRKEERRSSGRL